MPLAGIISCCLAFASLYHVVGWVWERALWGDYSRRGREGLWGIWQLSSDINSSPTPSSLLFFVVAYLFIWRFWSDADTCPACLIVIVAVCGVVRGGGGQGGSAGIKMGQFRLQSLWLCDWDPGLCRHHSTLWMLWRSWWTAEGC